MGEKPQMRERLDDVWNTPQKPARQTLTNSSSGKRQPSACCVTTLNVLVSVFHLAKVIYQSLPSFLQGSHLNLLSLPLNRQMGRISVVHLGSPIDSLSFCLCRVHGNMFTALHSEHRSSYTHTHGQKSKIKHIDFSFSFSLLLLKRSLGTALLSSPTLCLM